MSWTTTLRALGPIDIRGVARDHMLRWMVFIPLITALALRWGVPLLTRRVQATYGFDLVPYYPVLLVYFFVLMCPFVFGVLVGFLLLDEKDDHTLAALAVTPLSLSSYLAYRVTIPVALTMGLMFVIFPLANLSRFHPGIILITAIAAAPLAPMFALYLAAQAANKVQGFALMKLSGVVLFAPVLAYFIHSGWEYALGIVPTYWAMKVYWLLDAGKPGVAPYLVAALLYPTLLTVFFAGRFNRVMRR